MIKTVVNQMITKLTHLNQELDSKAQKYQSTAEKLTDQLIKLTTITQANVKEPIDN